MSDVPLGVFLSGGIDSSTLVRLLTKFRPPEEIQTFSIGFDDPSFDESEFSSLAAKHLGTNHRSRTFSVNELLSRLPRIAEHLDEPFADPSILPVSMLCEFARQHVTVALGGDGGDELLAGYDPFRALGPARWYRRMAPRWLHERAMVPLAERLPVTDRNMDLAFRASRFLRGASLPPAYVVPGWMGPFTLQGLKRLAPDLAGRLSLEDAYAPERKAAYHLELAGLGDDHVVRALDFFQRYYLPDDILVKVDRASMMHSLEVRCPFLDPLLVAYANALPSSLKLRGGKTKWLLKELLGGPPPLLPREIVHRKKKGFGIPVAKWLRHELKAEFESRVLHDWPKDLAMFDRREIDRLWRRHLSRKENHYKELWALMMLAWWRQTHG
jgi:asparagine synthase (glutamine-hydrolysing)